MSKKYKKMSKKQLSGIEIHQTNKGFTLWITEPGLKGRRHWLVDASCLFDDGEIRVGNMMDGDKFHAIINSDENFENKIEFVVSK